jgi:hypothetical protein
MALRSCAFWGSGGSALMKGLVLTRAGGVTFWGQNAWNKKSLKEEGLFWIMVS